MSGKQEVQPRPYFGEFDVLAPAPDPTAPLNRSEGATLILDRSVHKYDITIINNPQASAREILDALPHQKPDDRNLSNDRFLNYWEPRIVFSMVLIALIAMTMAGTVIFWAGMFSMGLLDWMY